MADKRKNFYLMLDTETANGLDDPFVYDLGFAVVDKHGNVYHTDSVLIFDVYRGERELMQSAYYACKIPMYERQYEAGMRRMVRFSTAKQLIADVCKEWNITAIIAHNARFDYNALNTTQRYLTDSRGRYFLPYGIPLWCTLTMAKDVIATQKSYIRFCEKNPARMFKGRPRLTAEILYQYISGDEGFKEEHTGLADVMIEKEIFARCIRQKKKMKKSPWKEERQEMEAPTEIQRRIGNLAHFQN